MVADRPMKSVSHEETFATDVHDRERLRLEIVRMADSVHSRLRAGQLQGRTVTVKLRYGDFKTITRSHSLQRPVASTAELVKLATALLDAVEVRAGVRLLGVGVSSLEQSEAGSCEQLALWACGPGEEGDQPTSAHFDVDAAVDAIRERYGAASVGSAALVGTAGLKVKQLGDAQWGPEQDTGAKRPRLRVRAAPPL